MATLTFPRGTVLSFAAFQQLSDLIEAAYSERRNDGNEESLSLNPVRICKDGQHFYDKTIVFIAG